MPGTPLSWPGPWRTAWGAVCASAPVCPIRTAGASAATPSASPPPSWSLRSFGRKDMRLPPAELDAELLRQIDALAAVVRAAGTRVSYLKAHGALYNRMADDAAVADTVLTALKRFDPKLRLLTLPGSVAMERA